MSRVIQLRGVPEELHDALVEGARAEGMSLNKFALRELAGTIRRRQAVAHNQDVVKQARTTMTRLRLPRQSAEELAEAVRGGRTGRV